MKINNTYYILRHGESVSNVKDVHSCWPEKFFSPLTQKGRKEAKKAVEKLKNKNINLIFSSDILRTKQTAEIIGKGVKIKPKYDKRLREVGIGIFNGKSLSEFRKLFPIKDITERFRKKPKGGETYSEVKKRMVGFLKDIDKKYKSKNILIISHQMSLTLLEAGAKGIKNSEVFKKFSKKKMINTGELRLLTK
jgi:broad specificity phosphatase PhoE